MEYPPSPSRTADDIEPLQDSKDDPYDLAPDAPATKPASQHPEYASLDQNAASPTPPLRTLSYRTHRRSGDGPHKLDVDQLTKQTLPLWLLTGGLLIEGAITFLRARFWWSDPNIALLHLLMNVGVSTIVMMAGVLITAKVRQIQIGSLPNAMLRLAALIIATDAAADLLTPLAYFIPFGGIAMLLVNFALYFALLGTFFDLDESDTWYCLCVIFLIHLALYFTMLFFWK
jgi:hypothetical protein